LIDITIIKLLIITTIMHLLFCLSLRLMPNYRKCSSQGQDQVLDLRG